MIQFLHAFVYLFLVNTTEDFSGWNKAVSGYHTEIILMIVGLVYISFVNRKPNNQRLISAVFVAFHVLMIMLGAKHPLVDIYFIIYCSVSLINARLSPGPDIVKE